MKNNDALAYLRQLNKEHRSAVDDARTVSLEKLFSEFDRSKRQQMNYIC